MHSTKAEVVPFSSIRFLKNCQRRASRRTRLKQLILMALRMLLLALIIIGLAKPVLHSEATSIASGTIYTDMVLLIDNSYSMSYREEGRKRVERAKQTAMGLLDSLKPGDQAALIVVHEEFQRVVGLTEDIDRVKRAVSSVSESSRGSEISGAVADAYGILAPDDNATVTRRREIHLLTDLQAHSWQKLLENNIIRHQPQPRPKMYVSSFGAASSSNTFIRGVKVSSMSAGGAARIEVQVEMVGDGQYENIVTASVNGERTAEVPFTVMPGSPAFVPVELPLDEPGTYRCVVSIDEDNLTLDDSYEFSITVDDRVTVLVVDGATSSIPALSETFYLRAALNPAAYTGMRTDSAIDPTVITLDELPSTSLDPFKLVVLCNVAKVDGSELIRFESFFRSGGSMLVFLGDKVQPDEYNRWSFIPGRLRNIIGRADREDFMAFGRVSVNHPVFAGIEDLRAARVFRCFEVDTEGFDKTQTIASLRNDMPAVLETQYGAGRVLMVTTTADLDWTNLPLRRIFVPMVHRMVSYASGQSAATSAYSVGDQVEFRALAARKSGKVIVTDPQGNEEEVILHEEGIYAVGKYSSTAEPGTYKVIAHPDFTNSGGFCVNPDVLESDITMVSPSVLTDEFGEYDVTILEVPGQAVETVVEIREGRKLWPTLFKLGLLFFCLEIIVANLFSRTVEYGGVQMQFFDYLKLRRSGMSE